MFSPFYSVSWPTLKEVGLSKIRKKGCDLNPSYRKLDRFKDTLSTAVSIEGKPCICVVIEVAKIHSIITHRIHDILI